MARLTLKPESWPIPLRWLVAMVIVPMLPFAAVAAAAVFLWLLGGLTLSFLLIAVAYAMLLFVPAAWISFLPVYLVIDRWSEHSKRVYGRAAMVATVVGALLIGGYTLLTDPYAGEALLGLAFGLVVALPTSAWMGRMIWCVLWSGRMSEREAR
jgi:hypothetical protein